MKMHIVVYDQYTGEVDHRLLDFPVDDPTWEEINMRYALEIEGIDQEDYDNFGFCLSESRKIPEVGDVLHGTWSCGADDPAVNFFILIAAAPVNTIAVTDKLRQLILNEIAKIHGR